MRTFTGSLPSAASSAAPLRSMYSWPLSSATPRAKSHSPRIVGSNGGRLPEIERLGRLDVEVPVDHHRRRVVGVHRRTQLADRQRAPAEVGELALAAARADEIDDPLPRAPDVLVVRRVRAEAGDAQPVGQAPRARQGPGARLESSWATARQEGSRAARRARHASQRWSCSGRARGTGRPRPRPKRRGERLRRRRGASASPPARAASSATGSRSGGCARA